MGALLTIDAELGNPEVALMPTQFVIMDPNTNQAIPYAEMVCFRPKVPPKPIIAGTLPARLSSPERNDRYAEIDLEGRYRVRFLFDRDTWKPGQESTWLRLARPYGGDTHGLHLPMLAGTEVAVAFEQGDPDRPYIAHALHDSDQYRSRPWHGTPNLRELG